VDADEIIDFMGAKVKNLTTLGERSATGMDDTRGVLVVEVTAKSVASKFLQPNDVILSFNSKKTNKLRDLLEARMSVIGSNTEVVVFRNQKEEKKQVVLSDKK
jgi:S1-C subfamily serine protease